jgi:hypothetical protein
MALMLVLLFPQRPCHFRRQLAPAGYCHDDADLVTTPTRVFYAGATPVSGCILIVGVLAVAACGASGMEEVAPTITVHPDDQAIADGFVALYNDGNFSDNTDFAKTCSGGDGMKRWLSDYGECSDGTVIDIGPLSSCPSGSTFVGLLPDDDDFDAAEAATTTAVPSRPLSRRPRLPR